MGRMKSLGYAYAEHLGDGVDVDWYFESIVNGEIEIPKWFVEEWLEANPIFASEENDSPVKSARLMEMNIYRTTAPENEMDDWVVHGTNWYQITTNGPLGTKPESRQVSVDAYGIGSTEQLAREDFSKRASNYLSIQENDFHHNRNFGAENSETFEAQIGYDGARGFLSTMKGRIEGANEEGYFPADEEDFQEFVLDTIEDHIDIEDWEERYGAEDSEDYEVIMTNIGHSMERDGETIVFGDVVFATPNDGRSRISSYGQGADKASARQALIDRATDYLQEEEFNVEENFNRSYGRSRMRSRARCGITGLPIADWMAGSADGVCPLVVENPSATNEQIEDWITWLATNYSDWYPRLRGAIIEINEENFTLRPEDLEVYNAETKSWRMQNRDSKGRFTKGFVEEIDIGQFMEMDPEEIPLMPPITYTPQQVVEFINDCINMDNFPEQLMNSGFLDTLQQITASADLELLEGLSNAAHTSLIENGIYDDRAGMAAAKRAIFVTDVFLNFKWGQENWAAEDY